MSSGSESDGASSDFSYEKAPKRAPTKRKSRKASEATSARQGVVESVEDGLFGTVRNGSLTALKNAAQAWASGYEDDSNAAMITMINFMFQCCGAPGSVSLQDSDDASAVDMMEHAHAVAATMAATAETSYPLVDKTKAAKKFAGNFTAFWGRLVPACADSGLLFGVDNVVDKIIGWLTTISSADVRALRHTASVAALCTGLALITQAKEKARALELAAKQTAGDTSAKKKSATQTAAVLSQNVEALHASLEAVFNGVLVHRFRDVFAPIRAEVMRYLGEWVLEYPQHFLQNKYLKYIGWLLKDRDAAVRLSSLEATLTLLRNEDCAPEMNALVTRFRDRLIEMTQDVDANVAVHAYSVLIECSKLGWLVDVDLLPAEGGVFAEEKHVREAAAEFVVAVAKDSRTGLQLGSFLQLARRHLDVAAQELPESELNEVSEHTDYVRGFSVVSYGAAIMEYVVDAFAATEDSYELLHDWSGLCNLLLTDDETAARDEADQFLLLSLLWSCARHAAQFSVLSPKASAFLPEETSTDLEDMSSRLAPHIVDLITKFQSDPLKVCYVIHTCQYLRVNALDAPKFSKTCTAIITSLCEVLSSQSMPALLEATAGVLGIFSRADSSHKREIEAALRKGLSGIANRCLSALKDTDDVAITVSLARLQTLATAMDVGAFCEPLTPNGRLTNAVVALLRDATCSPQAAVSGLDMLFHQFMWCFVPLQAMGSRVKKATDSRPDGDEHEADVDGMAALRSAVGDLAGFGRHVFDLLVKYLAMADDKDVDPEFVSVVRLVAFERLSDFGVMTSKRLRGTVLAPLCFALDDSASEVMARCVDEALISAEVKPVKVGSQLTIAEEERVESARRLSALVIAAAQSLVYGFGFAQLALPMVADLDVPDAARAMKLVVKEMKSNSAEDLCNIMLECLWKLHMVTLDDSGALDLGKIMKKVKQLLVPKGRADKQFGLQILRMMQRGVVDVLVDVRAHATFLPVLAVLLDIVPSGSGRVFGPFFRDMLDQKLTAKEKDRLKSAQRETTSAARSSRGDDDDDKSWAKIVVSFQTALASV